MPYFLFILLHVCDAITHERLKTNNNKSNTCYRVKRAFQKALAWTDATNTTNTTRLQRQACGNTAILFWQPYIKIQWKAMTKYDELRTSDPDFGLFEVSYFRSGNRTFARFSDSPESAAFQALIIYTICFVLHFRKLIVRNRHS